MNFFEFFVSRWETILDLTIEHFVIVLIAMVISILLGTTMGILITKSQKLANIILDIASVMMTIPSLALFSLLIPILGLGKAPAIVGLVVYTQLPIIRNVYTGIQNISPSIIQAAEGMGLTEKRILFKIKMPLAFPAIITGIRTAIVMGIGIGAIGGYIGAGGLGVYIFQGISRTNENMILIGAIFISLMAILTDKALERIQKKYNL